jgi:hypothetical protein
MKRSDIAAVHFVICSERLWGRQPALPRGNGEKEFVSRFLNLMTNSYDNDEEMIAFLAPS